MTRFSLRSVLDLVFGAAWGQRIVVVGAIVLYLWLAISRPDAASAGVRGAGETFVHLFTLILASLLLASAIGTLLPSETVASMLGDAAGPRSVVLAGLLGGLLPGGPYAVYPIVESVSDQGASYPAMVTMLVGYSLIGLGRVPFGLGIFGPKIVLIRVSLAVVATTIAGLALYGLAETSIGKRVLS